jgi:hypothetical protein
MPTLRTPNALVVGRFDPFFFHWFVRGTSEWETEACCWFSCAGKRNRILSFRLSFPAAFVPFSALRTPNALVVGHSDPFFFHRFLCCTSEWETEACCWFLCAGKRNRILSFRLSFPAAFVPFSALRTPNALVVGHSDPFFFHRFLRGTSEWETEACCWFSCAGKTYTKIRFSGFSVRLSAFGDVRVYSSKCLCRWLYGSKSHHSYNNK